MGDQKTYFIPFLDSKYMLHLSMKANCSGLCDGIQWQERKS